MRNEPEMITGAAFADDYKNAPKAVSIEEELANIQSGGALVPNHAAAPKYGKKSKGVRCFKSENPKLRLQMLTTKPKVTPEGYWLEGESRAVQFKPFSQGGGYYETDDLEEVMVIEDCTSYGVSIYDVDAMNEQTEEARVDFVEHMVTKDKKLLERLKARLGAKDFIDKDDDDIEPKVATARSAKEK